MEQIEDKQVEEAPKVVVQYFHGRDDNHFFENTPMHEAHLIAKDDDDAAKLTILNADGNPTIPVSNVRRYADPQRLPYAAFWEPLGAKLPEPLWPPEPVIEPAIEDAEIISETPAAEVVEVTTKKKGRK
jgi:hypothetical protein